MHRPRALPRPAGPPRDEAASALDTESEATVKRNLDRMLEQRSDVIVAHRPSTIRNADTITVLELYHRLHASQVA